LQRGKKRGWRKNTGICEVTSLFSNRKTRPEDPTIEAQHVKILFRADLFAAFLELGKASHKNRWHGRLSGNGVIPFRVLRQGPTP